VVRTTPITMSTPTSYELTYPDPCDQEVGCGQGPCLGKTLFNPRPQNFCEDVTIQKDLYVVPAYLYVGGSRYKPTTIVANNGTFVVLAQG
jgi:hypothetical protein